MTGRSILADVISDRIANAMYQSVIQDDTMSRVSRLATYLGVHCRTEGGGVSLFVWLVDGTRQVRGRQNPTISSVRFRRSRVHAPPGLMKRRNFIVIGETYGSV